MTIREFPGRWFAICAAAMAPITGFCARNRVREHSTRFER